MILKIFGLALIGAAMSFIIKTFGWRGAPLVTVAAILSLMTLFSSHFEKIFTLFDTVSAVDNMKDATECSLKILGIGYLSGLSSDICKELGEAGIASVVMLLARLEILLIISPLIIKILTLGLELVK